MVDRHSGLYSKRHVPGMFSSLWKHAMAKYLGAVVMVIPIFVLIYYSYIASWTVACAIFSGLNDYWGYDTQEAMIGYLQSYQAIGDPTVHGIWKPFIFFFLTLGITIWVRSEERRVGKECRARWAQAQ